jgi:hypothetical protein
MYLNQAKLKLLIPVIIINTRSSGRGRKPTKQPDLKTSSSSKATPKALAKAQLKQGPN